jgi:hypothetical protein
LEQEKATMRLNYAAIAPEATKALAGVNTALLRAGLDKRLRDLLFPRNDAQRFAALHMKAADCVGSIRRNNP